MLFYVSRAVTAPVPYGTGVAAAGKNQGDKALLAARTSCTQVCVNKGCDTVGWSACVAN